MKWRQEARETIATGSPDETSDKQEQQNNQKMYILSPGKKRILPSPRNKINKLIKKYISHVVKLSGDKPSSLQKMYV